MQYQTLLCQDHEWLPVNFLSQIGFPHAQIAPPTALATGLPLSDESSTLSERLVAMVRSKDRGQVMGVKSKSKLGYGSSDGKVK